MKCFYIFMLILSQEVKIQGVFNKFISFYYRFWIIELSKLLEIDNCYSLSNLMYIF